MIPRAKSETTASLVPGSAWNRMADAVEGVTKIAVQPPLTITISNGQITIGLDGGPLEYFIGIKTEHTRDGTNWRWHYGWAEAVQSDQSYDDFEVVEGGLMGYSTDIDTRAYSLLEAINGPSGMTGIGVDLDQLPPDGGFTLTPIPDGTPMLMRKTFTPSGKPLYQIVALPNGINGSCTPAESEPEDTLDGGGA